jgi:hypothetical protein
MDPSILCRNIVIWKMKNLLPYRQKTYERVRSVFRGSLTKHNFVATEGRCFKNIIDLSVKSPCIHPVFGSPCIHPVFGPPFLLYPIFQWYPQSNEILLNLSMKCWNWAFNAHRLIIVSVQGRVVKIYVAAVEALRKKERQDETQFTTKFDGFFLSFTLIEC